MKSLKFSLQIFLVSFIFLTSFVNYNINPDTTTQSSLSSDQEITLSPESIQGTSQELDNNQISSPFDQLVEQSFSSLNNLLPTLVNSPKYKQNSVEYNVSDVLEFWVVDYGILSSTGNWASSFYQTNATVRAVSNHSIIFVEDSLLGLYDETFCQNMANEFENNIWDSEVPYFGTVPDVDGNGKVTILIMDIEDGSTGGSYIAGVFLRVNQYNPDDFPSDPIISHSMFMEIVHIDTQAIIDGDALGTLAHEFQHLIHFNSDSDESLWIDEGAATYASYKAGYLGDVAPYYLNSDPNYFLFDTDSSLTYWTSDLRDYSGVFLFFLYLSNRFGPNIVGEIVNSTLQDQSSVKDVLQTNYGYNGEFKDLFRDWTVANVLDLTNSSKFGYSSVNLNANIQSNKKISSFPKEIVESVAAWGTDIYEINSSPNPSNLKFSFVENQLGDFLVSFLSYSSVTGNWSIKSIDTSIMTENNFESVITDFSQSKISKVIVLVSNTDGVSSGADTISNENIIKKAYTINVDISSTEILYDYFDHNVNNETIEMSGIYVADALQNWNVSSIVYANYSLINTDTMEIISGYSHNLTFNENTSKYNLTLNISSLLPGIYQIHIFFSNGTLDLNLFSQSFEISEQTTPLSSTTTILSSSSSFSSDSSSSSKGSIPTDTSLTIIEGFGFSILFLTFSLMMVTLISNKRKK